MFGWDALEVLFIVWAVFFQLVLIIHFSFRKWLFDAYVLKYGWIVYALALPAIVVSILFLVGGKTWSLWLGGPIYLIWALYGYTVEYARNIQWRHPIRWSVFGPYVFLYLATVMFYWWPLGLISRSLWYGYAVLFIISTILNVSSHKPSKDCSQRT